MTMKQPNLLKILSETQFADGLPNKHLQSICRAARLLRVPAGQRLFQEGAVEDEIFVISTGCVRLTMNVPGRGEVPFLTAGPGDLIGWSCLIGEGRMTATAVSTEDSNLIALSGSRLRELCYGDADLGFELMKRIAQVLSQRLLSTRLQLLDLFGDAEASS
ncbi:MAG TPA: cyclic nucleotide-binding domain-containing protein [Planctomycetaceae bacterium]|nr:cyclic nucleotide-binding domain-containing protein [Planctomycetaceae bacterium]